MSRARVLAGLMAGLWCAGTALGGLITTEGFENYASGDLLTNKTGGTNWAAKWIAAETTTSFARIEDNTYIPPEEGSKQVHFYGSLKTLTAYRPFQAGQDPLDTVLYCQFYIRITALATTFQLQLGDSDGDVTNDTKKIHLEFRGGGDYGVYQFIANNNQVLLGKWDGSTGLPDARTQYVHFEVWGDRTNMKYDVSYAGTMIGNDLPWRITTDDNVLNRFTYQTGSGQAGSGGISGSDDPAAGGIYVDNIIIQGIPEPGSLIAWACAGLLMCRRRW